MQTDLFINLIKDDRSSIIGRIFGQKIEELIKDFNSDKLDFLKEFERRILNKEQIPFLSINKSNSSIKKENIKYLFKYKPK